MQERTEPALRFAATRSILLILVISPSLSLCQERSFSGPPISMSAATPFAGCYEMHLGRWWPWGMGEDTQFATPPQRVELQLQRGMDGFEQNGLLIRTIPTGTAPRRSSFWLPQGRDGVDLIWTSGFSGVSLRLNRHGKELRGWAHAHFDSPRPPHIARATARPIACTSAPQQVRP
jgi:hypothetical protein